MRKSIAAVVAALLLATNPGCAGVQGTPTTLVQSPTGQSQASFNAFVTQPVNPFVVLPGQTFIIIVQLVPINGFFLTGPVFFNSFFFVNPSLVFTCPNLLVFGTPTVGVFGGPPTISMPITPIGFGTCTIPINVGVGGIIPLQVQVSGTTGSSATQSAYLVRISKGMAHH
jgi:hypothetical protein